MIGTGPEGSDTRKIGYYALIPELPLAAIGLAMALSSTTVEFDKEDKTSSFRLTRNGFVF